MATPTTLPAAFTVGQVLTSTQMNDLRGAFRILQVVTAQTSVEQTSSSQTYADATSLTVSITPQATTSKILVSYSTTGTKSAASSNNNLGVRFVRGASTIATWGNPFFTGTALLFYAQQTFNYLDSPASIAALTYKVQFANANNNGASVTIQSGSSPGLLTVMEISA
jgi:hypothetical protein